MPQAINGLRDFDAYFRRIAVWKTLFLWESGLIDATDAAERLDLSLEDAAWLRTEAIHYLKKGVPL